MKNKQIFVSAIFVGATLAGSLAGQVIGVDFRQALIQPAQAADSNTLQFCQINFPAGKPLAQIVWDRPSDAKMSKSAINGKDSVQACGLVKVPKNREIRVTLAYAGLAQMEAIEQLKQCQVVYFNAAKLEFDDEHMAHLKDFKQLRNLQLGDTFVTDKSLPLIGTFSQLNTLRLSTTDVTGSGFEHIAGLKNLANLNLCGISLKPGMMQKLTPLLSHFNDVDCATTGLTKEDARVLKGMTDIMALDIHGNKQIDDSCMNYLSAAKKLHSLNVIDTAVSEKSEPLFSALPNLSRVIVRERTFWHAAVHKTRRSSLEIVDASATCRTPAGLFGPLH